MKAKDLSVLLFAFLLLGCATTKDAFNQAKTQDTIPAYEKFLAKYPKSDFTNEANNRLGALRKIEAAVAAKTKSILLSYKIGQTTFAEFERDADAGSWEKHDYKFSEMRSIEEGKSALEGKLLGSKAAVTVVYSPNKYCHLEFEGRAELKSAVLVSIKFY